MKKALIILTILFAGINSQAQKIKKDEQGNYIAVKYVREKAVEKETKSTYTNTKGEVFKVYESENGKLYIKKTSKAGNEYKQYLKIEG